VPWAFVAAAVLSPLAALGFWAPDAGADAPRSRPEREEPVLPAPREAAPAPVEERLLVPLRLGETVYADSFDRPDLDAFWVERSPAETPGYARVSIGNSRLCMAVGRKANGKPVLVRNRYRLHSRVELVSRPIALGKMGLSFGGKMLFDRGSSRGSWEWGCEYLAEDGRPIARLSFRSGNGACFQIGDRSFPFGRGRCLIVTPHGEVLLCDGVDVSRVFARKRLRSKFRSIRMRLFAAIPEERAGGGRAVAVWDRIALRRVLLGPEKP
jgi:hypothetical protein